MALVRGLSLLLLSGRALSQLQCDTFDYRHQLYNESNISADVENSTLEDCCQGCTDDVDCIAYTLNTNTSVCTFFAAALNLSLAMTDDGFVSGSTDNATVIPVPSPEEPEEPEAFQCDTYEYRHQSFNVSDTSNDIANSSVEDCCDSCFAGSDCWAYSLNTDTNVCTLFNLPLDLNLATADAGYISGSVNNNSAELDLRNWIDDPLACGEMVFGQTDDDNGATVADNPAPGKFRFFEVAGETTNVMFDTCQGGSNFNIALQLYGPNASMDDTLEEILATRIVDTNQFFVTYHTGTGYREQCAKAQGDLQPGTYWILITGRSESDSGMYSVVPVCTDPTASVEGSNDSGSAIAHLPGRWCAALSFLAFALQARLS